MEVTDSTDMFPLAPDVVHLNHAAVAPWPQRTAQAVQDFALENIQTGSRDYARWLREEQNLRERLARLISAKSSHDIALLKNTSEALSVVAYGLDWTAGENVVTSNQEFPSNRIVWESLADKGVELREADLSQSASPEDAILALVTDSTRLITISSVQYDNGLRMDLNRLGDFCRKHGILFCVDAIQSVGALQLDVNQIHADFLMADGHKWMCGPEGLALFYSTPEAREQLKLNQYGWHMVNPPYDFDRREWDIAKDARRFECGSPNFLGIMALNASLSVLEEIGAEYIESQVLANTDYLRNSIPEDKYQLLSPAPPERRSGILTLTHRTQPNATVYEHLVSHGVICALRGGGIRLSPHFYTPKEKLDFCVARLNEI